MENFKQIFTLLANHESIGLNTDILETGLVNIIALVVILIYTGRDFLGSLLEERQMTIIKGVQNAEDRLTEAEKRLTEAKKQLNQVNLIIDKIKTETLTTKKTLLASDAAQARNDLKVRFERGLVAFRSKERTVFLEIKQQIVTLVLQQTVARVQKTFQSKDRATTLIDATINKLEGDLL